MIHIRNFRSIIAAMLDKDDLKATGQWIALIALLGLLAIILALELGFAFNVFEFARRL